MTVLCKQPIRVFALLSQVELCVRICGRVPLADVANFIAPIEGIVYSDVQAVTGPCQAFRRVGWTVGRGQLSGPCQIIGVEPLQVGIKRQVHPELVDVATRDVNHAIAFSQLAHACDLGGCQQFIGVRVVLEQLAVGSDVQRTIGEDGIGNESGLFDGRYGLVYIKSRVVHAQRRLHQHFTRLPIGPPFVQNEDLVKVGLRPGGKRHP